MAAQELGLGYPGKEETGADHARKHLEKQRQKIRLPDAVSVSRKEFMKGEKNEASEIIKRSGQRKLPDR